jgi:hypothetical protein
MCSVPRAPNVSLTAGPVFEFPRAGLYAHFREESGSFNWSEKSDRPCPFSSLHCKFFAFFVLLPSLLSCNRQYFVVI